MATEQQQPTRGFWNLIALQAQVAFNDNVFKMLLMLAAFDLFSAKPDVQATYNSIIGGLIPAAFLIFSCWGGMLADKFSKRSVILTTKTVELFIVILGFLVLWFSHLHGGVGYGTFMSFMIVAFILYIHSAFFSPSKYSIIPELVSEKRITWANGILGLTTYLAIILGVSLTTFLFKMLKPDPEHHRPDRLYLILGGMIVLSIIGLILGLGIGHTAPANPRRRIEPNFSARAQTLRENHFRHAGAGPDRARPGLLLGTG